MVKEEIKYPDKKLSDGSIGPEKLLLIIAGVVFLALVPIIFMTLFPSEQQKRDREKIAIEYDYVPSPNNE
ncbi:MAG: hypothetical protein AAF483_07190 [Planctomycetota bacterium]